MKPLILLMLDALCERFLLEAELMQDQLYFRQHNLIRSVALAHLKTLQPQR